MSIPVDLSTSSLFNIQGKIALVTGGSSGIGKMIAAGLAQNGAKVYIASRKEAQLKEAVKEISLGAKVPVDYIVADVSNKAGCEILIAEFRKRECDLHILVNNSGITWGAPFNNFPEAKGWDNIFNVNVKSIFYMTSGLADMLAKGSTASDPARVINISSTSSVIAKSESAFNAPGNGTYSYGASKAAVNHLTSQLAVTLLKRHIMVNAILPGLFPSKMTSYGIKEYGEELLAFQPTGRVGAPQDMAGLTLFLCSPASAHITGQHIIIDGGAAINSGKLAPEFKL